MKKKGSKARMTVLFGTVEFFKNELLALAKRNQLERLTVKNTSRAYYTLKEELLFDFVCDEAIRCECLQNLEIAYKTLLNSIEEIPKLKV
ncbi:hypothetical protein ACF5W4_16590 [Bacillota bacterium Lsc_1132]